MTRNKQNENKQRYRPTSTSRVNNQLNHGRREGSGVSLWLMRWIRSVTGLPDKYADPGPHGYQCRLCLPRKIFCVKGTKNWHIPLRERK